MLSFIFICAVVLFFVQSIDIKFEKRKDDDNYDMVITDFDIGQFNRLPGDPDGENVLRIEPRFVLCVDAVTHKGSGPRLEVKCRHRISYALYAEVSHSDAYRQTLIDSLVPRMYQHKVAIPEKLVKSDRKTVWRLIEPKLLGEAHPETEDIVIEWQTKTDELKLTHFDEQRAGLKDKPKKEWGKYYSVSWFGSSEPTFTVKKKGPVLYFYEHKKGSAAWIPYVFQKMTQIKMRPNARSHVKLSEFNDYGGIKYKDKVAIARRKPPATDGVLFTFRNADNRFETKMLTLEDIASTANEERIAFDSNGKFLLLGKKKINPGKKTERKVKFDLSARDEIYGDNDNEEDYDYYDEYDYEELSRLLRLAQKLNSVYRSRK